MSYLTIKRRRDMRRQRWQFLAVFVTITLGVMLFAASYDAFLNLESSYRFTYDRVSGNGHGGDGGAVTGQAVTE